MVLDEPDDVEAVANDLGVGKPFPDQFAVAAAEVDADDFDLISPLKTGEKGEHLFLAFTGHDVEDLVVAKVAEGGGKALFLMQRMLVDPKDDGALKGEALGGFALVILGVDPLYGGVADIEHFGQSRLRDSFVMELGEVFPKGLRASSAGL